jgi:lipopolysaccharide biosynthesis glycosyltransferase
VRRSRLFDENWYLQKYPDVRAAKINPALHFCKYGWREGRSPGPEFDTKLYLQSHGDVESAGINPLVHYEKYGRKEGRRLGTEVTGADSPVTASNPVLESTPNSSDTPRRDRSAEILHSGFWDEDWYLSRYYDEFNKCRQSSGGLLSPLEYYVEIGWRLGHRPSKNFSLTINKSLTCDPVTYFLNQLRFESYHFDENVWYPDDSEVRNYLEQQAQRVATKVVYTCITNNYNDLMQPFCIDPEWDYVCYTDCDSLLKQGRVGVWEIRRVEVEGLDYSRLNRWHKINPHILFPQHKESLYIDGNINIISDYIYRNARSATKPMLFPQHFARNCAYDEMKKLMASPRISIQNKGKLAKQYANYKLAGFPRNLGLSENNVIYRKHHNETVKQVMKQWWEALCDFSSRDQASLSYVLWKNGITLSEITFPNIRINYKDFWIVKHVGELENRYSVKVDKKLSPVFEGNTHAAVMSCNQSFVSYLGVVLTSIIENSDPRKTYDLIVLESDIEEDTKTFITNSFAEHANVSIRFYNMSAVLAQLGDLKLHVDGYVPLETYNKIFLSEITNGYERIAYVDTDIVVNADIADLCGIELWGKAIGSSKNIANIHAAHVGKRIKGRNFRKYLLNDLGIEDYNQYFQAGIVVLDMHSDKVKNLFSLAVEKLKSIKKPVFYDQCVFNSIFYGDVSFFSVGWNHVWYLQAYSYIRHTVSEQAFFDYASSRLAPKIVHFASKDKPTNKAGWDLAEYFWRYAEKSPYYDQILSDIDPVVRREDKIGQVSDFSKKLRLPRVLVHLHVHYPDQIPFLLKAIGNIRDCDMAYCVTASDEYAKVVKALSPALPGCRFIKVPNLGYDAYPFLKVLQDSNLSKFDYVIKLHTKNARPESRDKVYGIDVPGFTWRDDLVSALLGSEETFRQNLQLLENDRSVGAIGAAKYLFSTLENNEEENYNLCEWRAKFNIDGGTNYFGGTMFMARAFPFERLKRYRLEELDFEEGKLESGSHKDKAHIFERLFGLVVESEGFVLQGTGDT